MTPAEKQALDEPVEAVARPLSKAAAPSRLQALGGLEKVIHEPLQAQVSPQRGVFCFAA